MENKRLIVLFATIFSILFSAFYYFLFQVTMSKDAVSQKRTLYMNQVGLYEKEDGVNAMIEKLKNSGFVGYKLKQDSLTAVVCSVGTKEKLTKQEQEKLQALSFSYIEKSVTVEEKEIVEFIDTKQYEQALERIGK